VNILFVCSKNKWRSRTAETIFQNDQRHKIRSAGTENDARIRITEKLVNWADLIFVMEKRHKERLEDKYRMLISQKEIIILNIQDEYQYMDSELIEMLRASVSTYLE
jgi:protein-tyrosine phosphatase